MVIRSFSYISVFGFPLSVQTLTDSQNLINKFNHLGAFPHDRNPTDTLKPRDILYILWSTVALEAKNFVAMALVLEVRERPSVCKSLHIDAPFGPHLRGLEPSDCNVDSV